MSDAVDVEDHERTAVEALKQLGLTGYEAKVFVALVGLGAGSAREVAAAADVPRSQVYGAGDDLAEHGLVEVEHASPKRYHPVNLETARDELTDHFERERERAFDALRTVQDVHREDDADSFQGVATVQGHEAVTERVERLLDHAERSVVHAGADPHVVPPSVVTRLQALAEDGVDVLVVSKNPAVRDALEPPVVVGRPRSEVGGEMSGRLVLVDDDAILLSERPRDGNPESAVWTANDELSRLFAQFFNNGVDAVVERRSGGDDRV